MTRPAERAQRPTVGPAGCVGAGAMYRCAHARGSASGHGLTSLCKYMIFTDRAEPWYPYSFRDRRSEKYSIWAVVPTPFTPFFNLKSLKRAFLHAFGGVTGTT